MSARCANGHGRARTDARYAQPGGLAWPLFQGGFFNLSFWHWSCTFKRCGMSLTIPVCESRTS